MIIQKLACADGIFFKRNHALGQNPWLRASAPLDTVAGALSFSSETDMAQLFTRILGSNTV